MIETIIVAAQGAAIVWLYLIVRDQRDAHDQLIKRLNALEVQQAFYLGQQDKLAEEWREIFQAQQTNWDRHIEKVTNEVTVRLAHTTQIPRRTR